MRVERRQLLSDVGGIITDSNYVFMITYKGLKVKQFEEMRNILHKLDARCHVLKNRVFTKAAESKGLSALAAFKLDGDTAYVVGKGDPAKVAKSIMDFQKKFDKVSMKGGYFEGAVLTKSDVALVAELPPREILLAQLLGLMQAPASQMVRTLNAKLSGIVNVLNSHKQKLEKSNQIVEVLHGRRSHSGDQVSGFPGDGEIHFLYREHERA